MLALFVAAALAYAAASYAYGSTGALSEPVEPPRLPRALLAVGAVLHFSTIGALCAVGQHPLSGINHAVSLGLLLVVIAYLAVSGRSQPMPAIGSVLAPLSMVALTVSVVAPVGAVGVEGSVAAADLPLVWVHVAFATAGLAGSVFAATVAGLYLVKESRLRAKLLTAKRRGISIAGLEKLQWSAILVTVPVFTVAIATGIVVALRPAGPLAQGTAGPWLLLELIAAGLAWLTCLAVLSSRLAWGLRGRRAAALTLLNLLWFALIVASYALR